MKKFAGVIYLCLLFAPIISFAQNSPQWWVDRGAINGSTNAVPNDYAAANQGQLKWMAIQCAKEFESRLPAGAGPDIWNVVGKFSSDGYDNTVFNQGQLKALVKPFYDRLDPDYVVAYPDDVLGTDPWIFSEGLRNDYAAVNIGQLKRVFSFDFDRVGLVAGGTRSISGMVSYSGSQQSSILVVASRHSVGFSTAYSAVLAAPGNFIISGIPTNQSIWIRAFLDTDGNGIGNGSEPMGESALNPFTLTDDLTGVNIVLSNVGDDGDSLPDWWELNHFGTLTQNDSSNFDEDNLTDLQEFLVGSDPGFSDTDGDGLYDDIDPNPLAADADGNGLSDGAESALASSTNSYGADGVLIHVPDRGWRHAVEPNLKLIPLGE